MVKRIGFAFFVELEYEKIPEFCNFCNDIGHSFESFNRRNPSAKSNKKIKGAQRGIAMQIFVSVNGKSLQSDLEGDNPMV